MGGFSKGGYCRVECHAQGNKKCPMILGLAVHLALRAPQPREAYTLQKKPSKTPPFLVPGVCVCVNNPHKRCATSTHSPAAMVLRVNFNCGPRGGTQGAEPGSGVQRFWGPLGASEFGENKVDHSEASKRSRFPGCPLRGFQPSGSYPWATDDLFH